MIHRRTAHNMLPGPPLSPPLPSTLE
ncbi:hypothetical protein CGRA01v4_07243 [Colletotrichum graminicola]|nr:hypothetical protein CGRA01v4_07243 [Colletotrichum graminicola]